MTKNRLHARPATIAVGYQLLAADGGVFSFGRAEFRGAPRDERPGRSWAALTRCGDGGTVLAVATDGSVAFLGPSPAWLAEPGPYHGSNVVGVAATPTGQGYWLLDGVGGVFCFGDATYLGSIPGLHLEGPVVPAVDMASTPTGNGYWILDRVGGVHAFGDAGFFGSVPGLRLSEASAPAVALAASPTGEGYTVLEEDGVLRGFGDARALAVVCPDREVAVCAFAAVDDRSFVVVNRRGLVYPVGHAPMFGSAAGMRLEADVVGVVVFVTPNRLPA